VISDQPLISRTAMMSTPYCSSPIEKLMDSTRPEVAAPSSERSLS
jgi:hypothetical protein